MTDTTPTRSTPTKAQRPMLTRGNEYGVDALGNAILWSSRGQQVMMEWEKAYMEECADALQIRPTDRVLEIGFGLAYSATRIQTHRPRNHTIIECDAGVIKRAREFARTQSGDVDVVEGTWQSVLPSLGEFDCVFFDDYPLPELETESHASAMSSRRSRWHSFLDVALHHIAPGGRITGYLAREIDLMRTGCRVQVSAMHVDTSSNCNYYPHDKAFVPVITVLDRAAASSSTLHLLRDKVAGVREQLLIQDIQNEVITTPSALELKLPHDHVHGHQDGDHHAVKASRYAGHASRAEYLAALRARASVRRRQAHSTPLASSSSERDR